MAKANRDLFASRLGMLAATLGSSVGLGNIWKFPALTGNNGGASFLLIYVLSTLLVGLPLMISEMVIGRSARGNALSAFSALSPARPGWRVIGALGILGALTILAYYSDVAGWVFAYIFKAVSGSIATADPKQAAEVFSALRSSAGESLLWQWVVLGLAGAVIVRGASGGIEKVTRVLIPLLFVLLVAVCVRSLTLPGAAQGLRFLFMPDFARINAPVILTALGLAFFKLSVGFGCMITYGSYYHSDVHVPMLALRVMLCDLTVSILAGVAIFPAVFTFGFEPTQGTSLLFLTIPAVFSSMPGGQIFTTLFFVLSAVAAMGAILSLLEVPVAWLAECPGMTRRNATLLMMAFLALFGLPAAWSSSVFSGVSLGGGSLFDMYDFLSSNVMLPVDGLLLCLFTGWAWKRDNAVKAFSQGAPGNGVLIAHGLLFLCRYVTPVLILAILLNGLGVI